MEGLPTAGFVLPSKRTVNEDGRALAREMRATAAAAAEAGADTLWVWDHMLKAPVYTNSWHDPFVALGSVADFGLRLGTGVLVAPIRPPVQTAMAVASLQALSGRPMRLGVGTGWNPAEFKSAGVPRSQRGARTDEFLDVLDSIFRGESDFSGRYLSYDGVDTGQIGGPPEVWIAGGTRKAGGGLLGEAERAQTQQMAEAVAQRILRYRRWIIRPSAEFSDFQQDVEHLSSRLRDANGGGAESVRTSVIAVTHLVETDDRDEARRAQQKAFGDFVSEKRPLEYIEQRYLLGSLSEVRSRLAAWADAGLEHIGLYLLGEGPQQIHLARKHLSDLVRLEPAS